MESQSFKAIITSPASKVLDKSNGGQYVLHNAVVQEGKLKGMSVLATRTIKNKDGEEKKGVEVDQEVTLYLTVLENEAGQKKPFFEIQAGMSTTSDADIIAALGLQNL